MQCGFCLPQIGEFAFIIASLGLSLHVTEGYLYPIVVAGLVRHSITSGTLRNDFSLPQWHEEKGK